MDVEELNSKSAYLEGELIENPESFLFLPLAYAYLTSDKLEEAEEICKEGLEKYPYFTSARVLLGYVYHLRNEDQKAGEELSIVLKEDPGNLLARRLLGKIYVRAGDTQRGIEEYRKALSICPWDEEATQALEKLDEPIKTSAAIQEKESEGAPPEAQSIIQEKEFEAGQSDASSEDKEEKAEVASLDFPVTEQIDEPEGISSKAPSSEHENEEKDRHFYARALADIFIKQGAVQEAVDIFSTLPEKEVGEGQLQEKLKELEMLLERERSSELEGETGGASIFTSESSAFREHVEHLKGELKKRQQSGQEFSADNTSRAMDVLKGWLEAMGKKAPGDEGESEHAQNTDPERPKHESSGNEGTGDIRFADSG